MSLRLSTCIPRACSGDMYFTVPRITLAWLVVRILGDSEADSSVSLATIANCVSQECIDRQHTSRSLSAGEDAKALQHTIGIRSMDCQSHSASLGQFFDWRTTGKTGRTLAFNSRHFTEEQSSHQRSDWQVVGIRDVAW